LGAGENCSEFIPTGSILRAAEIQVETITGNRGAPWPGGLGVIVNLKPCPKKLRM
jgi:hypothetical protein